MCGIAGFTRRSKGASKGVAERITEAISHRGPDQQGVFEGSEATLCAVRLKIIDLDGGDQPILSDNRDTAIVFNGEIYNHQEVRGELESLGHRFHSNCDTETVLRAYLEWDTACFSRMRGMFAVAGRGGDQAAVLLLPRRGAVFRIGTEGDSGASGGATALGSGRAGYVLIAELRGGDANADPGDPEGGAGAPAGMAPREAARRSVVEITRGREARDLAGGGQRGTGLAVARCGAGASDCGRSAGGVGIRGPGFIGDPALRGGKYAGETEDVLGIVSRAEL